MSSRKIAKKILKSDDYRAIFRTKGWKEFAITQAKEIHKEHGFIIDEHSQQYHQPTFKKCNRWPCGAVRILEEEFDDCSC